MHHDINFAVACRYALGKTSDSFLIVPFVRLLKECVYGVPVENISDLWIVEMNEYDRRQCKRSTDECHGINTVQE